MKRKNISSGAVWEDQVGYMVEVAGTTATNGDQVIGIGNPYEQTLYILQKIERALEQAGASMADVVRTRIYLTDISHWQEVGRAHGEFFRDVKPASTMVQVSALIHPDQLVEMEATAVLQVSA